MNAAAQAVNAQIDPVLQNITDSYNTDAQNMSDQLGGIYGQYAAMQGDQVGVMRGIYDPAIQTQQNTAEGVKGNIMQAGEHAAAGLASTLSQAGLPANAGGTDINLSAMGGGSSDAAYALGQASIQALKSAENAAVAYASKLPGFAKLEGDYQTQTVLSQLAAAMTKQLAATTAQAPGLYYQIYNDLEDRRRQAANDAEQIREFNVTRQDNLAKQRAGMAGPNAPTTAGRTAYWQSVAQQRSKDTGDVWQATSTGIRPFDANPKKPGIQRTRTEQGRAADSLIGSRVVSAQTSVARAQTGQQNADTAARRADIAAQAEAHRHAAEMKRLQVAQQNAQTAAQRARIANRRAIEIARNNRARNGIAIRKNAAARKKPAASGGLLKPKKPD
ncbi:MAG TPA: hypothetical protein VNG33_18985 [Polyangiaceae bacterium]|nr:hypothetical protein [Polyangiaceae bacterium]